MSKQQLVTKDECRELRMDCTEGNKKIELALFGTDGRGGIVKDIQDIKTKMNAYGGAVKQFALPIAVAVIVAILVRFLP